MSVITQAIGVDGLTDYKATETYQNEDTKGTSSLGKDAFLTLLTTQMKYQDPLNPSSDTEFIGQLAQFSALEEMQNVSAALSNQTAHSLVGKNVIMAVGSSSGETSTYVAGLVEYTEVKGDKVYLSIDGELYNSEDSYSVVSESYLSQIADELD